MICFVACAFGHTDVDKKYKVMKRVLESFEIRVRRVDRIEFNSKIDAKIIDLIQKCDFGIADLTYARPSVYYEAGRIHGLNREMIFTCDRSYLDTPTKEKRVHFDLLTHNIIGWSADEKFERDLKRRIRQVILPLLKEKKVKDKTDAEVKAFSHLSIFHRREAVELELKRAFVKAKWSLVLPEDRYKELVGVKGKKGSKQDFISGYVADSYTYRTLSDLWVYRMRVVFMLLMKTQSLPWPAKTQFQKGHSTMVVCSLKNLTDATIQKACPQYSKFDTHEKIYVSEKHDETVVVVDNIRSIPLLKSRLDNIFLYLSSLR